MPSAKKQTISPQENAEFQISLKVILKNREGKVLLLKPSPTSATAGYFDLPGGRIRKGQEKNSLPSTIARELREEIGKEVTYRLQEIPVAVSRHFYFSQRKQQEQCLFWVFFEARYKSGTIKISDEHMAYQWVRITSRNLKRYFTTGGLEGMWLYTHKKFQK